MVARDIPCPVCGSDASVSHVNELEQTTCPACGVFYKSSDFNITDEFTNLNKVAWFLYYNAALPQYISPPVPKVILCKYDSAVKYRSLYPYCEIITTQTIENWYPVAFSERIDLFLQSLLARSDYPGTIVSLNREELTSSLFISRYSRWNRALKATEQALQLEFMMHYLQKFGYVSFVALNQITLSPPAYQRIDDLHRQQAQRSKSVFIAISFATNTQTVRETIRIAIEETGYQPIIMDEVEHNHQIVPEMLHQIRQARFVVAELSEHNNGAYYEAGYANGIGKEVIHVCRQEELNSKLHFDVKQINTVVWSTLEELKDRLVKRIQATIQ